LKKIILSLLFTCVGLSLITCASDLDTFLVVSPASLTFTESGQSQQITIAGSGAWKLVSKPVWCSLSPDITTGNGVQTIHVTVHTAPYGTGKANITWASIDNRITTSVAIDASALTLPGTELTDESYYQYRSCSKGPGINLVLMGDGYTANQLASGGKYETDMWSAVDAFFAIEPYTTYQDYFNVYIIGAVSKDQGIGTGGTARDTKFKAYHTSGSSMYASNIDLCFTLAETIPGVNCFDSAIILIANSTQFGGTCHTEYWSPPGKGRSVAICPSNPNGASLVPIVQHEAGGHGFGRLADEYWTNGETIDQEGKNYLLMWQNLGYDRNVSIINNPEDVSWSSFIKNQTKYWMVGTYQGAYQYQFGVWRSENHSCMRENDPYFNAPSRALIVERIKNLADEPFSIEWFMSNDHFTPYARNNTYSMEKQLMQPPLPPPVRTVMNQYSNNEHY